MPIKKSGSGKTKGAGSFVVMPLADLNNVLKDTAQVIVSRRFAEALSLEAKAKSFKATTENIKALGEQVAVTETSLDDEPVVTEQEEMPIGNWQEPEIKLLLDMEINTKIIKDGQPRTSILCESVDNRTYQTDDIHGWIRDQISSAKYWDIDVDSIDVTINLTSKGN